MCVLCTKYKRAYYVFDWIQNVQRENVIFQRCLKHIHTHIYIINLEHIIFENSVIPNLHRILHTAFKIIPQTNSASCERPTVMCTASTCIRSRHCWKNELFTVFSRSTQIYIEQMSLYVSFFFFFNLDDIFNVFSLPSVDYNCN